MVLCVTYARKSRSRLKHLLIETQLLEATFDQAELIGFVVDSEVASIANGRDVPAQYSHAKRMKRRDYRVCRAPPQQRANPLFHLLCCFVSKCNSQNGFRENTQVFNQMDNSISYNPCFA